MSQKSKKEKWPPRLSLIYPPTEIEMFVAEALSESFFAQGEKNGGGR